MDHLLTHLSYQVYGYLDLVSHIYLHMTCKRLYRLGLDKNSWGVLDFSVVKHRVKGCDILRLINGLVKRVSLAGCYWVKDRDIVELGKYVEELDLTGLVVPDGLGCRMLESRIELREFDIGEMDGFQHSIVLGKKGKSSLVKKLLLGRDYDNGQVISKVELVNPRYGDIFGEDIIEEDVMVGLKEFVQVAKYWDHNFLLIDHIFPDSYMICDYFQELMRYPETHHTSMIIATMVRPPPTINQYFGYLFLFPDHHPMVRNYWYECYSSYFPSLKFLEQLLDQVDKMSFGSCLVVKIDGFQRKKLYDYLFVFDASSCKKFSTPDV